MITSYMLGCTKSNMKTQYFITVTHFVLFHNVIQVMFLNNFTFLKKMLKKVTDQLCKEVAKCWMTLYVMDKDWTTTYIFFFHDRNIAILDSHNSTVTSLAVSPDGKTLLTAGRDNIIIVWDLANYQQIKTIPIFEVSLWIMVIHIVPCQLSLHNSTITGLAVSWIVQIARLYWQAAAGT